MRSRKPDKAERPRVRQRASRAETEVYTPSCLGCGRSIRSGKTLPQKAPTPSPFCSSKDPPTPTVLPAVSELFQKKMVADGYQSRLVVKSHVPDPHSGRPVGQSRHRADPEGHDQELIAGQRFEWTIPRRAMLLRGCYFGGRGTCSLGIPSSWYGRSDLRPSLYGHEISAPPSTHERTSEREWPTRSGPLVAESGLLSKGQAGSSG